jgi:hypothetical protein
MWIGGVLFGERPFSGSTVFSFSEYLSNFGYILNKKISHDI